MIRLYIVIALMAICNHTHGQSISVIRAPRDTATDSNGPSVTRIGEPRSNSAYCRGLLDKKAEAERWANSYVHPDNIQRERNRAKNYDNRYFSDCYGG